MSTRKISIPEGLASTLEEFVHAVLIEKPPNYVEFAATYFAKLATQQPPNSTQPEAPSGLGAAADSSNQSPTLSVPPRESDSGSTSDTDGEPEPPRGIFDRRRTVMGQSYDPAADPDYDKRIIHPKTDDQRAWLRRTIASIFFFTELDETVLAEVLDAFEFRDIPSSTRIITQGDEGDAFYVIYSGRLEAHIRDLPRLDSEALAKLIEEDSGPVVKVYDGEGFFGELALLFNQPRLATVIARTNSTVAALNQITFKKIVVRGHAEQRARYHQFLASVPILSTLADYERDYIADALQTENFEHNARIIEEDTPGSCMYFLEKGEVRITKRGKDGVEQEVNRLKSGQYFGELALLTKNPRACSAYALGDVRVASLQVEAFERMMGPVLEIMKRNAEAYEAQMKAIFGDQIPTADLRRGSGNDH